MESYAFILRGIAEKVGCFPIRQLATQPGIQAIYRATVYYPDMRAADAVATLSVSRIEGIHLETVYRGYHDNKPLIRRLTQAEYEAFAQALRPLSFDTLSDQTNIPSFGVDFCLLERGAGGYVKNILLAPQAAIGVYGKVLSVFEIHFPEVFRQIT